MSRSGPPRFTRADAALLAVWGVSLVLHYGIGDGVAEVVAVVLFWTACALAVVLFFRRRRAWRATVESAVEAPGAGDLR